MKNARYTYRFYPTPEQEQQLAQTFGCVRVAFNWGLRCQLDAMNENEKAPRFKQLCAALTQLKKDADFHWLNDVSSVCLQQSLKHLDVAWKNCFEKRAKRPRLKSKRGQQSAHYTKAAFRIKSDSHGKPCKVYLAKQKQPLDIKWSRDLPSVPTSLTITKDCAGRYFVSFVVEIEPEQLKVINKSVGIDLGLTHFAITSDGVKFDNPRFLQRDLERLAKAQRKYAKTQKGSSNREKARLKVARIHAKVADKRKDHLHKLSTQLIRENQAIAVETLAVKNMVRNRCLSRAISDVGWSMFVQMLEYKADWYGRQLVKIERWFPSSKTCSSCVHLVKSLPLNVRNWACENCGAEHDRDINAALNIKRVAGLVDLYNNARGEDTPGEQQLALF
jgi:putative transposase